MYFQSIGRWLVGTGIFLLFLGVAFQVLPRIPYVGSLPGDILIKRDHFTFYFPLTICILVSLALMLLNRFFGHK